MTTTDPDAAYVRDRLTFATAALVAFGATIGADDLTVSKIRDRSRIVREYAHTALADDAAYQQATGRPSPAPQLAAALTRLAGRPTDRAHRRLAVAALAARTADGGAP